MEIKLAILASAEFGAKAGRCPNAPEQEGSGGNYEASPPQNILGHSKYNYEDMANGPRSTEKSRAKL